MKLIDNVFDKLETVDFSNLNWRGFIIAMAGAFFMQLVQILGIHLPIHIYAFQSTVSVQKTNNIFDYIPKLQAAKSQLNPLRLLKTPK